MKSLREIHTAARARTKLPTVGLDGPAIVGPIDLVPGAWAPALLVQTKLRPLDLRMQDLREKLSALGPSARVAGLRHRKKLC